MHLGYVENYGVCRRLSFGGPMYACRLGTHILIFEVLPLSLEPRNSTKLWGDPVQSSCLRSSLK